MNESAQILLQLPRPSRAAWVVLIAVGFSLIALSAPAVVRDLDVAEPTIYLVLGAGIFLTFFALLILLTRQSAVQLRLHPDRVVIECRKDESVQVPLDAIAGVHVTAEGDGKSHVLSLQKNDGGWIELGSFPDVDSADAVAKPLRAALAAIGSAVGANEASEQEGDPLSRLTAIPAIALGRVYGERDGEVTLSWGAGSSLTAFLFLGPLTGMLIIVYGFHRYGGGFGTLIAMAFVATLGLVLVIFTVVNMGVTQRLRLDEKHLSVERLRFGKVLKRQQLLLTAIAAVDYSHRLSVTGAGLTLRSGRGKQAHDQALATARDLEDDDAAAAAVVANALMKTLGSGVHVPLGKLSLAAKIALDLALSDEIARRLGKAPGQL